MPYNSPHEPTRGLPNKVGLQCWQTWTDEKLKWNESDYGGLSVLHVGDHELWQPDIVLYNR
jgi:hypothetical protein